MKKMIRRNEKEPAHPPSRIPAGSTFYEKVVPAILILLAVATVLVVGLAAGVLLGVLP